MTRGEKRRKHSGKLRRKTRIRAQVAAVKRRLSPAKTIDLSIFGDIRFDIHPPSSGGFIVPEDFAREIAARRCQSFSISGIGVSGAGFFDDEDQP